MIENGDYKNEDIGILAETDGHIWYLDGVSIIFPIISLFCRIIQRATQREIIDCHLIQSSS